MKFNVGDQVRWEDRYGFEYNGEIEAISDYPDKDANEFICFMRSEFDTYYAISKHLLTKINKPKFKVGQEVVCGIVLYEIKWVSDEIGNNEEFEYVCKSIGYVLGGQKDYCKVENRVTFLLIYETLLREV